MSEPSPEAKQAAEKAWEELVANCWNAAKGDWMTYAEFDNAKAILAEHFDTATAKAREELEEAKAYKDRFWEAMKRVNELKRQLAHQPLGFARDKQPSAITCEKCGRIKYGDHGTTCYLCNPPVQGEPSAITTNEQAYRDGTLSQPSAPLVEEAFNKLRSILKERSKGEVDTWGFVAMFMDMIDEAERAALTGTGEKHGK